MNTKPIDSKGENRKPLYLRLEDFRIIRNIMEDVEETLSDDEKVTLNKTKQIIFNIERSIIRKARENVTQ